MLCCYLTVGLTKKDARRAFLSRARILAYGSQSIPGLSCARLQGCLRAQTSPLADDVQCSKSWQQLPRCLQYQCHDAAGLPDCRRPIERGESRPRELPLGVRHVWPGTDSRVEQSRSAGHELLLLSLGCCFAERRARSPAIQIQATDTRGHACDIVQSIHTGVLVGQRPEA